VEEVSAGQLLGVPDAALQADGAVYVERVYGGGGVHTRALRHATRVDQVHVVWAELVAVGAVCVEALADLRHVPAAAADDGVVAGGRGVRVHRGGEVVSAVVPIAVSITVIVSLERIVKRFIRRMAHAGCHIRGGAGRGIMSLLISYIWVTGQVNIVASFHGTGISRC
jgi:hypothetical protein